MNDSENAFPQEIVFNNVTLTHVRGADDDSLPW